MFSGDNFIGSVGPVGKCIFKANTLVAMKIYLMDNQADQNLVGFRVSKFHNRMPQINISLLR